ncbi:hypothetical protein HCN44_006438 [Aphidius gifuensis]|uniref:Transcription initiation factor IIF subunit alpha n=1 Tax=Aphidius gifuensis TaxID=684658 RepID=A0A834XZW0_APHGI|nr:hypothetical protein HCN44_006438 [Aphidius gifuensis]
MSNTQEFSIRVPKSSKKKYNVMRFNATLNVDFTKWGSTKMERENNMKEYKGFDEEMPKFGAGSEFGRDAREEARRKKFGINSKKYKPDNQPWILKSDGKTGKKFKGIREGGISENTSYYVFTQAPGNAIEAFPIQEWYNFQPIQRYKTLSAEEAEHEFSRGIKTLNYYNLMVRHRCKNEQEGNEDGNEGPIENGKKIKSTKFEKDLKISDMDELMSDNDDDDDDDDDENDAATASGDEKKKKKNSDDEDKSFDKKKKNKGKQIAKKKKKNTSDDEAFEDSDDGDEEGRERDYISDSSDSEPEKEQLKQYKGVSEEDGLRNLIGSDDEDEDEENNKTDAIDDIDDEDNDDAKDKADAGNIGSLTAVGSSTTTSGGGGATTTATTSTGNKTGGGGSKDSDKRKDNKKKKSKKNSKKQPGVKQSSSDFSSDSDTDPEISTLKEKQKEKDNKIKDSKKINSTQNSRSATPIVSGSSSTNTNANKIINDSANKRKHNDLSSETSSQAKKIKTDNNNTSTISSTTSAPFESGISEEAVRRYLTRKPMTTTELLQKFKSKKTGMTSDELVQTMTQILKKINPTKQMIQHKMYLSLKG